MKSALVLIVVAALADAKKSRQSFFSSCTIGCIQKPDYPEDCVETTTGCRHNDALNTFCGEKTKGGVLCYVEDGPCGYGKCLDDKTGQYNFLPAGMHQGHCPEGNACLLCSQAQEHDETKKCADICKVACEGFSPNSYDDFPAAFACDKYKEGKLQ
ncbi:hypothetical protein NQ176_g7317 [Zarea fungicola]|uniref:Uncharacterized protein n=1 Tax=Zarea fungicola TaxID=93591 RepID=A0ACC1N034_9HYPO|nr:hypothetical protein NQ176_g7317 [Lecanicillium fungicola]